MTMTTPPPNNQDVMPGMSLGICQTWSP